MIALTHLPHPSFRNEPVEPERSSMSLYRLLCILLILFAAALAAGILAAIFTNSTHMLSGVTYVS